MALVCSDMIYSSYVSAYQSHEADALIVRQASFAGGLGACHAPSGEREGQSPLACATAHMLRPQQRAQAESPTRVYAILKPLA